MTEYEPIPFLVIDSPQQIKAFTDPLRTRVLNILAERAATNQQLADALQEPQAKVLHHIRVLVNVGLVVQVETRVRGGNVEKYYRSVARTFGLQPSSELRNPIVAAHVASLQTEVLASATAWPNIPQFMHADARRLTLSQATALYQRIIDFLAEQADPTVSHDAGDEPVYSWEYGFVLFRNPNAAVEDAEADE